MIFGGSSEVYKPPAERQSKSVMNIGESTPEKFFLFMFFFFFLFILAVLSPVPQGHIVLRESKDYHHFPPSGGSEADNAFPAL